MSPNNPAMIAKLSVTSGGAGGRRRRQRGRRVMRRGWREGRGRRRAGRRRALGGEPGGKTKCLLHPQVVPQPVDGGHAERLTTPRRSPLLAIACSSSKEVITASFVGIGVAEAGSPRTAVDVRLGIVDARVVRHGHQRLVFGST